MKTITKITAQQAQGIANQFLSDFLSDCFCADLATLNTIDEVWQVPVILAYPMIGSIGQVGEIRVSLLSEDVILHTPIEEMKEAGIRLYEEHRNDIETAFL